MDIFDVLSMIGGLALFLYGMNAMGNGLEKLSGGKLEKILEKLTSNKWKAVLLGLSVTAVIQSSSATTVMVVGFVNSGIMKLGQAIGIIMGANIGTTVTSWILSLAGIESNNLFVQLFNPSNFSPILAILGIAFIMFSKKEKKKIIGNILIGFAILMFGMDTMSGAVAPLKEVSEFTNILLMFQNPIIGMLVGAVFTAIIQSSSASVGILQALCLTGAVNYATALPIIMGQNIGTCITAIISSIGTTKNAKRAAAVHLYFNVIGTTLFMGVFYCINAFVPFKFMQEAASPVGIAIIHSIFNVVATICLLPMSNLLEKLAILTIRDHGEDDEESITTVLDERFLDSPSYAIIQCKNVTVKMAQESQSAIFKAMDLFENYDEEKANEVIEIENKVDMYEDAIGSYLVKLSSHNLTNKDSQMLSMLLHCIGDLERITDHAMNLIEAAKEMKDKDLVFSKKAVTELDIYSMAIRDIITTTFNVLNDEDEVKAKTIEPLEEVIDNLSTEMKRRHVQRLRHGKCTIELGFVFSDILSNYERVSDHCSNIAIAILQMKEGNYDAHEYLESLKKADNEDFQARYIYAKQKYLLPD